MPFRLDPEKYPNRTKIQFLTSAGMPNMIYKACQATGVTSNTVYIQRAVCAALARDLNIPLEDLLAELPSSKRNERRLHGKVIKFPERIGPGNTIEEVR